MKQLLQDIVNRIATNLLYFSWVGVIDDELLPPEGCAPPFCGVKDGGIISQSLPRQQDTEQLTVIVVPYQSIVLAEPGAAVMGSASQLGEQGKGLLDISDDLKTLLNDELFDHRFHYAHRNQLEATRAIGRDDGGLLQMQRNIFRYRRIL